MNTNQRLNALFNKYLDGTCSPAEWEEFLALVYGIEDNDALSLSGPLFSLWEAARNGQLPSGAHLIDQEKMYAAITGIPDGAAAGMGVLVDEKQTPVRRLAAWRLITAAAIAGAIILAGVHYAQKRQGQGDRIPPLAIAPDRAKPGINKAVLILGNGQRIVLDSAATGAISRQGNTLVLNFNGKLAYETGNDAKTGAVEPAYNTVITERANQYQLTLPDGSSVWLNAASSIRFPIAFTGKDRTVEITGEAYFEIKKNAAQPFHVKVKDMDLQVLGTHFNVNAYRDEATIKTSLLEGSVKITDEGITGMLAPGQEADITGKGELKIAQGNVELATAWKNGYFQFDQASLALILRQIGRWYDLDIRYEGTVPDRVFSGKLQRSLPLSAILHLLQKGDIHFKTEGRTLTVKE
jgi:ferric-dicitrate binding protein FerR (iron transport regulator)